MNKDSFTNNYNHIKGVASAHVTHPLTQEILQQLNLTFCGSFAHLKGRVVADLVHYEGHGTIYANRIKSCRPHST